MLPLSLHYSFSNIHSLSLSQFQQTPWISKMLPLRLTSHLKPPKSFTTFNFDHTRCLPSSKDRVLIRGSRSRRDFGGGVGRVSVSGQKNMTELVGIDGFMGSSNVSGGEEADAILRSGSPSFGGGSELRGSESTLNRMSKWIVLGLFGLFILWKHDAEAMWAAMGSIINSCISFTLKQLLNHQRPNSTLRSDPGMPSSHAQSIFYTACFSVVSLFHWLGMSAFTVSAGSIILICGSYFTWLRVAQQLHTISQVVVGGVLGAAFGVSWFWIWHSFVLRAFIASIWVRIVVVLGSVTFCAAFLLYVIQHWLKDE